MQRTLIGLEGVECEMYHILIFGGCQKQHDMRLEVVLSRLETVTLNPE